MIFKMAATKTKTSLIWCNLSVTHQCHHSNTCRQFVKPLYFIENNWWLLLMSEYVNTMNSRLLFVIWVWSVELLVRCDFYERKGKCVCDVNVVLPRWWFGWNNSVWQVKYELLFHLKCFDVICFFYLTSNYHPSIGLLQVLVVICVCGVLKVSIQTLMP